MIEAFNRMAEAGQMVGAKLVSHYGYENPIGGGQSTVKYRVDGRTTKEFILQHSWAKEQMVSEIKHKITETLAIK